MKFSQGILIGSDFETEWILKWWWGHYEKVHSFPIAIVDFGMSQSALSWCKQIGTVLTPPFPLIPHMPKSIELKQKWESVYSKEVWQCRTAWFKKPFALLSSPFDQTIWLDLDCEILGPIDELFALAKPICLAKEPERSQKKAEEMGLAQGSHTVYNTGVIGFSKPCPILEKWASNAQMLSQNFLGDQDVLSWTFEKENMSPTVISPDYNWRLVCGENPNARIIHHAGKRGKLSILQRL